jgi:homoserine O-acetyltransferase/O-succinyltransferase
MSAPFQVFTQEGPFKLESGACLPRYHLAYTTHGRLNAAGDNVVWVFHALTANSDPAQWWPGLVGEGKLFDPSDRFIVCVNMPGSCYGSIGPLSIKPGTQEPYYHDFPFFTTRDMIRAYRPLREFLGIKRIHIGIGGSMGGQQLLEWAIEEPELFRYIVPIATNARHSPWGIAFNTSQRMAIEADATWKERREEAGRAGMRAARATALLSYRHYDTYLKMQPGDNADSYQRYQGEKLVRRFSAFSYYALSQSMDSHDTGRGRGGSEFALQRIRANTLVVGIRTDLLFPLTEQEYLAAQVPGAVFVEIPSLYGHDGFLLEFEQIEKLVRDFIREEVQAAGPLEKNRLDLP